MHNEVKIESAMNGFVVEFGGGIGPKEIHKTFKAAADAAEKYLQGKKDVPDRYASAKVPAEQFCKCGHTKRCHKPRGCCWEGRCLCKGFKKA